MRGAAVLATAALSLSACTSVDRADEGVRSLRIGWLSPPVSLDPAQASGNLVYAQIAYEPLIYVGASGDPAPGLAASWKFLGAGNLQFELRLRDGVVFGDGSELTADLVKANLERTRELGGQPATQLRAIESIETVDSLTVRLSLSEPTPLLPRVLGELPGYMVGRTALDDPSILATQTVGAGQYKLDPAETVSDDHYTYVPNPDYWDPARIVWEKIVVRVLPDSNTALSALQTGQVDFIQSQDPNLIITAEEAGLKATSIPAVFLGLALADRNGEVAPALADVRVRQALNYAVDRESIARGIYGEHGAATEQIVGPGQSGYNEEKRYPYDPERARELLAEAGYPDGFSLAVVSVSTTDAVVQAVADNLREIGVDVAITAAGSGDQYLEQMRSRRFPAYGIGYGFQELQRTGPNLFLPGATQFNPFGSSDEEVARLFREAAAADPQAREALERRLVARIVELGWFVPVTVRPLVFLSSESIEGIQVSGGRLNPNPVEFRPAE
ncbi:ABC transporter substrate-binding protein [Phytohabitans kaempferiae]|uniref:ABC transporter substrate-binding protein n=1 Tax=Phytohabitans kaempferiae TaxID=1620943 RepID=A0ABV6MAK8_9ACTN